MLAARKVSQSLPAATFRAPSDGRSRPTLVRAFWKQAELF